MYKSPKKDNNNEADYFFCYSLCSHIFNSKSCWKNVKLTDTIIKCYWSKYFSA